MSEDKILIKELKDLIFNTSKEMVSDKLIDFKNLGFDKILESLDEKLIEYILKSPFSVLVLQL